MKQKTLNTDQSKPMAYDALLSTVDMDKRIKTNPYYQSWQNNGDNFTDSIREDGKIDYGGLNDFQKICLYVYAWNKSDIVPGKRGIMKTFNWTEYKLNKIRAKLKNRISTVAAFSEDTGLLSGKGFYYDA